MSISSKARAERQAKERKRWKKRQANRPIVNSRHDDLMSIHQPFNLVDIEDVLEGGPIPPMPNLDLPFKVTYNALPDTEYQALSKEWRQKLDPLCQDLIMDTSPYIDLLEEAIQADLPIPRLWNMLGNAYMGKRRDSEAGTVFREVLERFPDYFFGPISYACWLINIGRIDEVLAVMGGDFDMQRMLRGRKVAHVTELVAFHALIVQYSLTRGEIQTASLSMILLEQYAPDHPTVALLREMMMNTMTAVIRANTGWRRWLPW